jgi:hypothetical protein
LYAIPVADDTTPMTKANTPHNKPNCVPRSKLASLVENSAVSSPTPANETPKTKPMIRMVTPLVEWIISRRDRWVYSAIAASVKRVRGSFEPGALCNRNFHVRGGCVHEKSSAIAKFDSNLARSVTPYLCDDFSAEQFGQSFRFVFQLFAHSLLN